jgi:hypothetical protein
MAELKFTVPTEMIDLPSKGKLYPSDSPLASGQVEMKYMTAKEEDILTNVNLLRQGVAIERMLKSLIITPINYEDLTLGDRNALLVAARILGYGKDYNLKMTNPTTGEEEQVVVDLQTLKYKEVDMSIFDKDLEATYELPFSKNVVTIKMLTVGDDKKIDDEMKAIKKTLGYEPGASFRLKFQLTSVNGDRASKTVRDFIDQGALLARDSNPLRQFIGSVSPDIEMKTTITFKDGTELDIDVPMQAEFFFPGSGI